MIESEALAVAKWEVGSCLMMVRKSKQVGLEQVFESLHSWSIFTAAFQILGQSSWRHTYQSQLLQLEY